MVLVVQTCQKHARVSPSERRRTTDCGGTCPCGYDSHGPPPVCSAPRNCNRLSPRCENHPHHHEREPQCNLTMSQATAPAACPTKYHLPAARATFGAEAPVVRTTWGAEKLANLRQRACHSAETHTRSEFPPNRKLPCTPPATSPASNKPRTGRESAPKTADFSSSNTKPPMQ